MEVSFWLHTETLVLNHTLAQIHLLLMRHTRRKNTLSTVTKVMKMCSLPTGFLLLIFLRIQERVMPLLSVLLLLSIKLFLKKFTEVQLTYNVVLISSAQQSDSVIYIYICYLLIPNSCSFPSLFHHPRGNHKSVLYVCESVSVLSIN